MLRCIFCVLSSAIVMSLMISLTYGQEGQRPMQVPPSQKETKTTVIYKEKSYYDFEDVLIKGNIRAPDGSFIFRKSDTGFSSALNLKRSFIPELKESSSSAR